MHVLVAINVVCVYRLPRESWHNMNIQYALIVCVKSGGELVLIYAGTFL